MNRTWPKTFADLGFTIKAKTLIDLFIQAGKKLTQLQAKKIIGQKEKKIELAAPTATDLLYQFLTELLFLKDRDQFLANQFDLTISQRDNQYQLQGTIKGGSLPQDPQLVLTDIKAVTYHQLEVKQTKSGWQARVVVDV